MSVISSNSRSNSSSHQAYFKPHYLPFQVNMQYKSRENYKDHKVSDSLNGYSSHQYYFILYINLCVLNECWLL